MTPAMSFDQNLQASPLSGDNLLGIQLPPKKITSAKTSEGLLFAIILEPTIYVRTGSNRNSKSAYYLLIGQRYVTG